MERKEVGKLRPGTVFEHGGKRYMRQRGTSRGQVFGTAMVGGLFSDGVWLPKSEPVEVVDTSMALTPEQERET